MKGKIYTFQPLIYRSSDERFRVTNLGAIVEALTALGWEAQQVAYAPEPGLVGKELDGILLCSPEKAEDPSWWSALRPRAVISNTWGAPRFKAARDAILRATPKLLERLDTDGIRSPLICWPSYIYRDWSAYKDYPSALHRRTALAQTVIKGVLRCLVPGLLDKKLALSLSSVPVVTAESPQAVERLVRFQQQFGYDGKNLHYSPFPVNEKYWVETSSNTPKENLLISVGRWNAHQKNFPLLLRVTNAFLLQHESWQAILPGALPGGQESLLKKCCPLTRQRIILPGPLNHQAIYEQMARSKIFFMPSRYESFGIAAAEALCLGASVVGPAHIPSVPWFCGSDSGTVATLYTKNGLLDALAAEATLWSQGARSAEKIANHWRSEVGALSVARKMLRFLGLAAVASDSERVPELA